MPDDRYQNAEQIRKRNIEVMGQALGEQYAELWQNAVRLHVYWAEYKQLFGTKKTRVELMNHAAPSFFRMLQDELWYGTLMHLGRLTDRPKVAGQDNLTIRNLPTLIDREPLRSEATALVEEIENKNQFCRQWRNLKIAHIDLMSALKHTKARKIEPTTLRHVDEALALITKLMQKVHVEYFDAHLDFNIAPRPGGAVQLLYTLRDGLKYREQRRKRLSEGKPYDDDLVRPGEI